MDNETKREEVKELIAQELYEWDENYTLAVLPDSNRKSYMIQAEAILSLGICKDCGGTGNRERGKDIDNEVMIMKCPTCKDHPGLGGKLLYTKEEVLEIQLDCIDKILLAKKSGWDDCEKWYKGEGYVKLASDQGIDDLGVEIYNTLKANIKEHGKAYTVDELLELLTTPKGGTVWKKVIA